MKRDHLKANEVFYYLDEFTISWLPTLHKIRTADAVESSRPTDHDSGTLGKAEAFWIGGCKLSQGGNSSENREAETQTGNSPFLTNAVR